MSIAIKPIEASSVHQIQSGQVIVDLCSVVKELVENAIDAEASGIEVRFDNYGLDRITVQDNGTGIAESNYEGIALKHYTSKLCTYEDLSSLNTFGFRGEALSSLCALSSFTIITAQAHEAPKGKRLEFEVSGKLRSTTFVAAQKGTIATVENLFSKLPVRQKELSKNIKREYGKVIGLLNAYACVSTNIKFTVKNSTPKVKTATVFSTKGNSTTRENIANVYGAKMLVQLIELDLKLVFRSSTVQTIQRENHLNEVIVVGHISKPVFGEGRQTPDRQMFFVNGRPCGLPQIAKAINEVYKSFNVSQSPFIFADFRMDTNAYDVNVSPDKRTILLHDATALTDQLKEVLTGRFDDVDQTVPQSQAKTPKLPAFRQLHIQRGDSMASHDSDGTDFSPMLSAETRTEDQQHEQDRVNQAELEWTDSEHEDTTHSLLKTHFQGVASTREVSKPARTGADLDKVQRLMSKRASRIAMAIEQHEQRDTEADNSCYEEGSEDSEPLDAVNVHVQDFNARMKEQEGRKRARIAYDKENGSEDNPYSKETEMLSGVVEDVTNRTRPRRTSPQIATITMGDRVITKTVGSPKGKQNLRHTDAGTIQQARDDAANQILSRFSQRIDRLDQSSKHKESHDNKSPNVSFQKQNGMLRDAIADTTFAQGRSEPDDLDEDTTRRQEEGRVQELIELAEQSAQQVGRRSQPSKQALSGSVSKDQTTNLVAIVDIDLGSLAEQTERSQRFHSQRQRQGQWGLIREYSASTTEEERLSLTISKSDFSRMHIVGQFNLGFIIAVRQKTASDKARQKDELFIIDQHASDEKYNFERLQAETIVDNQRLVHPVHLDLTAVEEEIILENQYALEQNGFQVETNVSGDQAVGKRCQLTALPLSKETTFNTKDFDELVHLLSEHHVTSESTFIPRPTKVRKMFAMRACRSSIMIGKTLSHKQMSRVLQHMGTIDKPWNCPHGRPTMRHLTSLDSLDHALWTEGDGLVENENPVSSSDTWRQFLEH